MDQTIGADRYTCGHGRGERCEVGVGEGHKCEKRSLVQIEKNEHIIQKACTLPGILILRVEGMCGKRVVYHRSGAISRKNQLGSVRLTEGAQTNKPGSESLLND